MVTGDVAHRITLADCDELVRAALVRHDTSEENAQAVAEALVSAEADGLGGHGLSRVASYAAQAASGKINGHAQPLCTQVADAAFRVDARCGFAYPALACARDAIVGRIADAGVVVVGIFNSHHFGAAGYHVERLAERGVVALLFGNSPKAIAPWGGQRPLFGTNPIAFAAPQEGEVPLVIDMSLSKVARGKVMVAAQRGEAIQYGWALDRHGEPTTDARAALEGAMLPIGDAKGAQLVLMVEILAAALAGAHFGFEASSFFDAEGPAPRVGQLMIGFAPGALSGARFGERMSTLTAAILEQTGTRLPGSRRLANRIEAERNGLQIDADTFRALRNLAGRPAS